MSRIVFFVCLILFLALPSPAKAQDEALSAHDVIELSTAQPALSVGPVWVEMDVCGSGVVRGRVFLNSLADYRDRASLNAFIPPWHRDAMQARLGAPPEEILVGYRVRIYGEARQVRINWLDEAGQPTGEYYFQTQFHILGPRDLDIVMVDGEPVRATCGPLIG